MSEEPRTPIPEKRRSISELWWHKSQRLQNKVHMKRLSLKPLPAIKVEDAAEPETTEKAAIESQESPEEATPSAHVKFSSPLVDEISQHHKEFVVKVESIIDQHFQALQQDLHQELSGWPELIKSVLELK